MKQLSLARRWWRRLRVKRTVRRQRRLTGFEALEPRTVLSASGMAMGRPEHSFESRAEEHRAEPMTRELAAHGEMGRREERLEKYDDNQAVLPRYDAPIYPTALVVSRSDEDRAFAAPPPVAATLAPLSATPTATVLDQHLAPLLVTATPYVQSAPREESEVYAAPVRATFFAPTGPAVPVFVPGPVPSAPVSSAPSPASTVLTIVVTSTSPAASIIILPYLTGGAYERRTDSYQSPSVSYVSFIREAATYSASVRSAGSAALASLDESIAKPAEAGLFQRLGASLALASSTFLTGDWWGHVAAAADSDGQQTEPALPQEKSAAAGEAEDASLDSDAATLARKRKTALADQTDRPLTSTDSERPADTVLREALCALWDLWRTNSEIIPAASAPQSAGLAIPLDDGMIELLAADVAAVETPPIAPAAAVAVSQPVGLRGEVGLYQVFEVGSDSDDTPENDQVAETIQPPVAIVRPAGAE